METKDRGLGDRAIETKRQKRTETELGRERKPEKQHQESIHPSRPGK